MNKYAVNKSPYKLFLAVARPERFVSTVNRTASDMFGTTVECRLSTPKQYSGLCFSKVRVYLRP